MQIRVFPAPILEEFDDDESEEVFDFLMEKKEQKQKEQERKKQAMQMVKEIFLEDKIDDYIDEEVLFQEILDELDDEHYQDYLEAQQAQTNNIVLIPMNELQLAYQYSDKQNLQLQYYFQLSIHQYKKIIQSFCQNLLKSTPFQIASLLIILANSILIAINYSYDERSFLIFYSIETVINMIAHGFFFTKQAYFKSVWNLIDFSIIVFSYLSLYRVFGVDLSALRVLRILRSLQTFQNIKALRIIMKSLFASVLQLRDAVFVLIFSYSIFAIVGLILYEGQLKKRCINIDNGINYDNEVCSTCEIQGFVCAKQNKNPQSDLLSFDTFLWSIVQVFQVTTLQGWSEIMKVVIDATNYASAIYFWAIVMVGGFFLINLTLAIIKVNFTNSTKNDEPIVEIREYDYWQLRKLNIYEPERLKYIPQIREPRRNTRRRTTRKQTYKTIQRKSKTSSLKSILKPISLKYQNLQVKPMKQAIYYSKPVQLRKKFQMQGIYGLGKSQVAPSGMQSGIPKLPPLLKVKSGQSYQSKVSLMPYSPHSNKSPKNQSSSKSINNQNSSKSPRTNTNKSGKTPVSFKTNQFLSELSIYKAEKSQKSGDDQSQQDQMMEVVQFVRQPNHRNLVQTPHQLHIPKLKDIKQFSYQVKHTQVQVNDNEFDSVNMSVIKSMSSQEVEQQLEDFGYELEKSYVEPEIKKPTMRIRKRRSRKPKQKSQLIDDDPEQLKIKLFMTKFNPIVKYKQYKSQSEYDILKSRHQQEIIQREERIRKIKVEVSYLFKNQRTSLYVRSLNKTNENQTKQKSKSSKISSGYLQQQRGSIIISSQDKLNFDQIKQMLHHEDPIVDLQRIDQVQRKLNPDELVYLDDHEKEIVSLVNYQDYQNIINQEIKDHIIITQSSIEDVLKIQETNYLDKLFVKHMNNILSSINYDKQIIEIWLPGIFGLLRVAQIYSRQISQNQMMIYIFNATVTMNTIILSLDGLVNNDDLFNQMNLAFTVIFTIEISLKLFGYGIRGFIRDKFNIFDLIIVGLSLYEIVFIDNTSNRSVLGTVKVFRAMRVLRIPKLIRQLKYMGFLIKVLSEAFEQLIYILLLIILFFYIFSLLGISLFKGYLDLDIDRKTFDDFYHSFQIVFQVFTLASWNQVLFSLLSTQLQDVVTIIYMVLWIAIGNYVFLNLVLANLLDKFESSYRSDKSQIDQNIEIGKDTIFDDSQQSRSIKSHISKKSNQKSIQSKEMETNNTYSYFIEYNMCENSLFLFSQESKVRMFCYKLVKDNRFDRFILFIIFISSCKLVMDTYTLNYTLFQLSYYLDIVLIIIFALEAFIKIIAYGFFICPYSYLRDQWNILDFFIVIVSIVDQSVESLNLGFVKILRLLRTLRPLRFISHNRSMKVLVSALLQSIGGILNVSLIISLIWIMFAIVGINILKGKMYYCNYEEQVLFVNQKNCPGDWLRHDTNFDDILQGMLFLFVLSTLDGWPEYLIFFKDASDEGAQKEALQDIFWFFFLFILISIMLINMFIGVILVNFHVAEENSKDPSLTIEQLYWIDTQKLIVESKPNLLMYYQPNDKIRRMFFTIVKNYFFDPFISLCILSNIIVIALYQDDASFQYTQTLDNLNIAFSSIFILESFIKLIAFSPIGYFSYDWNKFDFLIVITSIIDIILNQYSITIGQVFKVLRVARLLRLIRQFKGLKKVIDTAIYSIPAILNAAALLFLMYFIFSILGVFLFQSITTGKAINHLYNFESFHNSFITLLRASTGEDWYILMYDTMVLSGYSCIYWIIFVLIQQFVLLNLFILIILDQYDANYFHEDNPMNKFNELEQLFLESWTKFSEDGTKLNKYKLIDMILDLKEPLGYDLQLKSDKEVSEWKLNNQNHTNEQVIQLKKRIKNRGIKIVQSMILQMGLQSDMEGFISYHQLLFDIIKNSYIERIENYINTTGARKLKKKEEESKKHMEKNTQIICNQDYNPLIQYIYKYMTFQALKGYSAKFKQRQNASLYEDSSIIFEDQLDDIDDFSNVSIRAELEEEHFYVSAPETSVYQDFNYRKQDSMSITSEEDNVDESERRQMQQYQEDFKKYLLDQDYTIE